MPKISDTQNRHYQRSRILACNNKVYLSFTKIEFLKEATKESFGILIKNRRLDPTPEIMDPNLKGSGLKICIWLDSSATHMLKPFGESLYFMTLNLIQIGFFQYHLSHRKYIMAQKHRCICGTVLCWLSIKAFLPK